MMLQVLGQIMIMKTLSRPTQFALPNVPPEHFLQPASNQKKSKYWRDFWEVNSARCVGADKEFIGKARCKLCIETPHYVSAISGTKSLHPWMLLQSRRLAVIFALLKGLRRKQNLHKRERNYFKIRSSGR